MIDFRRYPVALTAAILLHVFVLSMLFSESSSKRPVLTLEAENNASLAQPVDEAKQQVIKAVSVDANEVMETVQRLKAEQQQKIAAENARQKALVREALMAQKARVQEQQRLEALRQEEEKIAVMRKKRLEEEKAHLKQLAEQKALEEKRIAEMKQQQLKMQKEQLEAQKLAELKKQKELAAQKALEAQKAVDAQKAIEAQKIQEAKAKALLAEQQRAQAMQAALDANKAAKLSGEVNKYKALIINAISQQWILPDNVNKNLSSQFRIRLAPNGAVVDVTLIRSSGDSILDRSAQAAIFKASPLPVPADAETFNIFRDISLTVRPESARG